MYQDIWDGLVMWQNPGIILAESKEKCFTIEKNLKTGNCANRIRITVHFYFLITVGN